MIKYTVISTRRHKALKQIAMDNAMTLSQFVRFRRPALFKTFTENKPDEPRKGMRIMAIYIPE